jgi:2-dehydro-3-deoxygluconokinase
VPDAPALRAVVVGECLVELVAVGNEGLRTQPAGDTFNTASMLARASRALGSGLEVAYRTGLGDDPLSDTIASAIVEHGLTDASIRIPGGVCGLYLLDGASGSMWYWRGDSAARALFQGAGWLPDGPAADLVFLSLVTVQQMGADARTRAIRWLDDIRDGGGRVAFSTNHRATAWPQPEAATAEASRFSAAADIVLASVPDGAALFGPDRPEALIDRLRELGAPEAVVTAGHQGAWVAMGDGRLHVPAASATTPIDTTGAGDAFAGAYLGWRTAGHAPDEASRAASRVAAEMVMFVGAVARPGSDASLAIDRVVRSLAATPRAGG